jgi:hypothetical protein
MEIRGCGCAAGIPFPSNCMYLCASPPLVGIVDWLDLVFILFFVYKLAFMYILVVLASRYSSILVQLYYDYRTCNNPHITSTKHALEYKISLLSNENVKYAMLRTKFEMIPHPNFASSLCVSPRAHAQIATHILLHKNAGPWLSTAHKLDPQCLHTCQKPWSPSIHFTRSNT